MSKSSMEVVEYFKDKIKRSGFILDDDMVSILYFDDWNVTIVTSKKRLREYLGIGAVLVGFSYFSHKKQLNWATSSITAIAIPPVSYCLMVAVEKRAKYCLKKKLDELLHEFKSISILQHELKDFFKHLAVEPAFEESISDASKASLFELAKTSYHCQFTIADELKVFCCELSETNEFENINFIPYITEQSSVKACLEYESLIEGFIITLRSSLLTNIYYWCIKNPEYITKMSKEKFPGVIKTIKSNVRSIKSKILEIHVPKKDPPKLDSIENMLEKKKIPYIGKLKKVVRKLNNNVFFTMLQTKSVLETIEKVESKDELGLVEENLSDLIENISGCYESSVALKKLLEVFNIRFVDQVNDQQPKVALETEQQPCIEPAHQENENVAEKTSDNLVEDLDFQVFEGCSTDPDKNGNQSMLDIADIPECDKKLKFDELSYAQWLTELEQSGEFRRRKKVFKITKESVEIAPEEPDSTTEPSQEVSNSVQKPPPLPVFVEAGPSNVPPPPPVPAPIPPPLPPLRFNESEEDSFLHCSLMGALNNFPNIQEDTFE